MYSAILIILALFGTYTLIEIIEHYERTHRISSYHITALLLTVAMLLAIRYYNTVANMSYEQGYNDAIYEYSIH